jgi:hypothetical protein
MHVARDLRNRLYSHNGAKQHRAEDGQARVVLQGSSKQHRGKVTFADSISLAM